MLRAEWDPAAYADTYRQELLDLLASKTPVAPPAEERPAASATVDALMAALRDSVEAAKRARASDDAETRAG
jgi:non-homologous end joining protein Ku